MGRPPITARDRAILAFAAEHRFVLAAQAGRLLGMSEQAAAARMRALGAAGYLTEDRRLDREPPLFQATTPGLRAIDSDLRRPRPVDLSEYRHDAGLAWLAVAARRGRFGPLRQIVGERRMRSEDRRADDLGAVAPAQTHGVRLGGTDHNGRPRLHHPDLVVVTESGHRVAFELELSTKDRRRRERILGAYAMDRRIDAVVYFVDHPSRRRAIEASARRAGVADRVRVESVRLGHDPRLEQTAPARTARRTATELQR